MSPGPGTDSPCTDGGWAGCLHSSGGIELGSGMMDGMADSMLDRAIYSYSDVDRLVGVRPGTARRWLEGYERAGRFYDPVLREERTGAEVVTWGEMVEARLLAEFRRRDVPVQRLRPAIEQLREDFGRYPLARAKPFLDVEGRELVRIVQEKVGLDDRLLMVVVRSGQLMVTATTERFQESLRYDAGVVSSVVPERRAPLVLLDPARTFGQPAVRGVRTETLAEGYSAGATRDELADLYDLTAAQVDDAIRFELITGSGHAA